MAGMTPTMATNIMTKAEQQGRAQTAFELALQQAASTREQSMIGLGVDVIGQTGNVLTPEQASDLMKPGGQTLKNTKMTTGYGEGAIPSVVKAGVAATGEALTSLTDRGIGTGGGLAGQTRTVNADAVQLAKQQAVQEAQAKIAESETAVTAADVELQSANADVATARGVNLGKKKPKDLNIWGGKVHDAKGKTIRDATKKEVAAIRKKGDK
jgi:hypothetical protein